MDCETGDWKPGAGNRKGQAASEYLMTYGWAIFLLVAVIALILATGVFSPSYLISEECVLQPDIACTGYQLYREGGDGEAVLKIRIENRLGYDILLEDAEITATDLGRPGENAYSPREQLGMLGQGKNTTLTYIFSGNEQPPVGSVKRMSIALTYYSCAREVDLGCRERSAKHTVSGRITARVLAPG